MCKYETVSFWHLPQSKLNVGNVGPKRHARVAIQKDCIPSSCQGHVCMIVYFKCIVVTPNSSTRRVEYNVYRETKEQPWLSKDTTLGSSQLKSCIMEGLITQIHIHQLCQDSIKVTGSFKMIKHHACTIDMRGAYMVCMACSIDPNITRDNGGGAYTECMMQPYDHHFQFY